MDLTSRHILTHPIFESLESQYEASQTEITDT